MTRVRTYTLAEQERLIRSAFPAAALRAYARIGSHAEQLQALALERLRTIGHPQYGDAVFHKPKAELIRECDEELADAFVYDALIELREAGVIA